MIKKTAEQKFMQYLKYLTLTDLIGFSKLLNSDPEVVKKAVLVSVIKEDRNQTIEWEDFICSIVEGFSAQSSKEKRRFLRMARKIHKCNSEEQG